MVDYRSIYRDRFEDYTEITADNPIFSKTKIQQAKGHPEWLNARHPDIHFRAVACSGTPKLDRNNKTHGKGLFFIEQNQMCEFAEDAIRLIRTLWDSYFTNGDILWRENAVNAFKSNKLMKEDVIQRLCGTPMETI